MVSLRLAWAVGNTQRQAPEEPVPEAGGRRMQMDRSQHHVANMGVTQHIKSRACPTQALSFIQTLSQVFTKTFKQVQG
jgi:hypothetical protein